MTKTNKVVLAAFGAAIGALVIYKMASTSAPLPQVNFSTKPYTHNMTLSPACKYSGTFCVRAQQWGAYAVDVTKSTWTVSGGMVSPITFKSSTFQPAALTRCSGDFHQSVFSVTASEGVPKWAVTTAGSLGTHFDCTPVDLAHTWKVQVYSLSTANGLQYVGQANIEAAGAGDVIIGDTAYIDTGDGFYTPVDLTTCSPDGCQAGAPVNAVPPHTPQTNINGYTYTLIATDPAGSPVVQNYALVRDGAVQPTVTPIPPVTMGTASPSPTKTKTATSCCNSSIVICPADSITCTPTRALTRSATPTRTPTKEPTRTPTPIGCGVTDPRILCLSNRYTVAARWTKKDGTTGNATAIPFAATDTGAFWFFGPNNYEVMVKVLDGCGVNSRHWVFAGGLTNVKVEMSVTDTKPGGTNKTYTNPQGTPFQPIQDTGAFPCP